MRCTAGCRAVVSFARTGKDREEGTVEVMAAATGPVEQRNPAPSALAASEQVCVNRDCATMVAKAYHVRNWSSVPIKVLVKSQRHRAAMLTKPVMSDTSPPAPSRCSSSRDWANRVLFTPRQQALEPLSLAGPPGPSQVSWLPVTRGLPPRTLETGMLRNSPQRSFQRMTSSVPTGN